MIRRASLGLGAVVLAALIAGWSALFTVHETKQALVLQFGEPRRIVKEPGLDFKLPFVQNVRYFDRRVLDFDAPEQEVIAADQKRLVVDAFARYRIVDPLKFFQAVETERVARTRLAALLNAAMREHIGETTLLDVVSGERRALMARIQERVNAEARQFGVDLIDVRIKRTDLPEANSKAIYKRMRTEREREAREIRAQGEQRALEIRAEADRTKTVLLAEARRDSEILRGEGDAKAVNIFADAYGQGPRFFAFYRSMQAYREALDKSDTTLVLSPDSEFFRFFSDSDGIEDRDGAEGRDVQPTPTPTRRPSAGLGRSAAG